jgi:hypothetical protein
MFEFFLFLNPPSIDYTKTIPEMGDFPKVLRGCKDYFKLKYEWLRTKTNLTHQTILHLILQHRPGTSTVFINNLSYTSSLDKFNLTDQSYRGTETILVKPIGYRSCFQYRISFGAVRFACSLYIAPTLTHFLFKETTYIQKCTGSHKA